jgi:hypothetical protein
MKVTLKKLGLCIQLGHNPHDRCQNGAQAAGDDFVVPDINMIHDVRLDFCDCETSKAHFIQLLQYGWFSALVDQLKTAVTFSVLKHFQLLNFKSKASLFEFYNTLAQLTDNTGLSAPKVCGLCHRYFIYLIVQDQYHSFLIMVHKYQHLKMLKRAMRGYDPCGIIVTSPGECAVLCPACP